MENTLVKVRNLKKYFEVRKGFPSKVTGNIHAVDGVSFDIERGKTMGCVGESGCGKSTLGKTLIRLIEPTAGEVFFNGYGNIYDLNKKTLNKARRDMQIVFQDPVGSLDPRQTVQSIVSEPLIIHKSELSMRKSEINRRVSDLIEKVGLKLEHMYRLPHEFSGGQRQRIVIARALALNPKFIVLDEPTSALDVSVQAQVMNLIMDLQRDLSLTYFFISHDLSVIKHVSDQIMVMYVGKIVEFARKEDIFREQLHPYTKILFSAIPVLDPEIKRKIVIEGEVPSAHNPPPGCRFHPRCPFATDVCEKEDPQMINVGNGHLVACNLLC